MNQGMGMGGGQPMTRREPSYEPPSAASYERWPAAARQPQFPSPAMNMPPGYSMGAQPARPHAVRTPGMSPMGPMPGAAYGPGPGTMAASPRALHQQQAPVMAARGSPTRPPAHNYGRAQPIGHKIHMTEEEPTQGSKVGRFAWFVFGSAFGIFFAFFATGFVPRLGKKEEISFPPPVQVPTQVATPQPAAPPPTFARVPAPPPTFAVPLTTAPVVAPAPPPFVAAVTPPVVAIPGVISPQALPAAPPTAHPTAKPRVARRKPPADDDPPPRRSRDKADRSDRSERTEKVEKTEKADKSEKSEKNSDLGDLLSDGLAP
jgi:hypothetical protein